MVRWTRSPHDHADEASWREELDFALVVWEGASFVAALAEDLAQARAPWRAQQQQMPGGGGGGAVRLVQEYAALEQSESLAGSPLLLVCVGWHGSEGIDGYSRVCLLTYIHNTNKQRWTPSAGARGCAPAPASRSCWRACTR